MPKQSHVGAAKTLFQLFEGSSPDKTSDCVESVTDLRGRLASITFAALRPPRFGYSFGKEGGGSGDAGAAASRGDVPVHSRGLGDESLDRLNGGDEGGARILGLSTHFC